MVNLFHFSPCGTTEKCAKHILDGMGEAAQSINLLSPEVAKANPAEVSIVAIPVYSGHVPPVALERLDAALNGGGKAIGVAVYGNRSADNALNEINAYLAKKGFEVIALVGAIGQHSLCAKIGAGRPDATDTAALESIGAKIAAKLVSGETAAFDYPKDPEIKPYELSISPITTDECTLCGICEDECPTQVIELDDVAVSPAHCLGCAHCIEVCPVEAREFPAEATALFEQFLTATASERREPELFA